MATMKTVGDIARDENERRSRVAYAIEKAGIQERARAGLVRLFSPEQIPSIRAAIAMIKTRRRADDE